MIRSVLKSLLKPDAYPEPTSKVELIQTHVSWIFLTDTHAYKVKKPVDFGFLNFSTIDRRRFYCNEEIKYNSRLCPDIYLEVVELRETAEGAAFHGQGAIVDYAVKMIRLPAERMLDRLVAVNAVTSSDIKKVAEIIADFHKAAATSPSISEYGHLDRILFNWQENFEQMVPFEETILPAADRELIRLWVLDFARAHAELFLKRVADGYIRECDGDIHLENICLFNQKICIFDCIEFNERFRCCDTAADLAFLLMDLDFNERPDFAEVALNAYMKRSGDDGIHQLISFYKIYRAFVRGKVESFRLADAGVSQAERDEATAKAKKYFRLVRGYIERSKLSTTLFVTCGLMGCGKTTLASQLSFELGICAFNSDVIRKGMAGVCEESTDRAAFGEGLYSENATDSTYAKLIELAEEQLSVARSVIIDASFIRKRHRELCRRMATNHHARFVILYLTCNDSENRRRLTERQLTGRSASDGRPELLSRQREVLETPLEEEGLLITLEAGNTPAAMADCVYGAQ